jgi:hypothetical protein
MSYRKLYNNIINRVTPAEAALLDAVFREELKAIRKGDIEGAENRPYFYVNRNIFSLHTAELDSLNWIEEDEFALQSPLNCLNYIIDNITPLNQDKIIALRFISNCFNPNFSDAALLSKKIDKILKSNPQQYDAKIIGLLIETNFGGQTAKGLKYFERYDTNFLRELKRLFRDYFNRIIPIEEVDIINKAILRAISSKIRSVQQTNSIEAQEYIESLDSLKQEINQTLT